MSVTGIPLAAFRTSHSPAQVFSRRSARLGTSSHNTAQAEASLKLYKKAVALGSDEKSKQFIASQFMFVPYYRGQGVYAMSAIEEAGLPLPRFSTVAKAQGSEAPSTCRGQISP